MEGVALLDPGTVVDGRYRVEGVIGEGGMATVYKVRHLALGSLHALKVLSVSSRSIRDRMRQEGQFQAKLSHVNIVSVTDVIELGDDTPGLIMEYVDGPTLEKLLERGPLPFHVVDELANGIFAGVAEAHHHGLVHRDLKPSNVLMKPMGSTFLPKVADFGLAKATTGTDSSRNRTRTGTSMGTPHYMSPEQVRDSKQVAPTSDIFALGAILYEMVTGERAFDGPDILDVYNAVAAAQYEPVAQRVRGLPARMERAIVAALQVEPSARPQTVEALASLWTGKPADVAVSPPVAPISGSRSRSPSPAPVESVAEERGRWGLGLLLSLLGAGTVAVSVGVAGWWLVVRPQPAPPPPPPVPLVVNEPLPVAPPPPVAPEPVFADDPAPSARAPRTFASIQALARSSRAADRREAIAALADRTDPPSVEILDQLFRTDADPTVKAAAWRAIVAQYDASRGKSFADTVLWVAGEGAAREAAEATRAIGRRASDPKLLLPSLDHESAQVRAAGVDALPAVVARVEGEPELGAVRKRLRTEKDRYVLERIAALPEALRRP